LAHNPTNIEGFEGGDLTICGWSVDGFENCSLVASANPDDVRGQGAWAMRITHNAGAGRAYMRMPLSYSSNGLPSGTDWDYAWVDFWIKFERWPTSNFVICQMADKGCALESWITLLYITPDGTLQLDSTSGTTELELDRWYHISLYHSPILALVKIDNTQDAISVATKADVDGFIFGHGAWSQLNEGPIAVYDDVQVEVGNAIGVLSQPDEAEILEQKPNFTGLHNDWNVAGEKLIWAAVDESPHDGDTTYTYTTFPSTAGERAFVRVQDLDQRVGPPYSLVKTTAVLKQVATGSVANFVKFGILNDPEGTPVYLYGSDFSPTLNDPYAPRSLTWQVSAYAAPWNNTSIGDLQIGFNESVTGNTHGVRVTSMFAQYAGTVVNKQVATSIGGACVAETITIASGAVRSTQFIGDRVNALDINIDPGESPVEVVKIMSNLAMAVWPFDIAEIISGTFIDTIETHSAATAAQTITIFAEDAVIAMDTLEVISGPNLWTTDLGWGDRITLDGVKRTKEVMIHLLTPGRAVYLYDNLDNLPLFDAFVCNIQTAADLTACANIVAARPWVKFFYYLQMESFPWAASDYARANWIRDNVQFTGTDSKNRLLVGDTAVDLKVGIYPFYCFEPDDPPAGFHEHQELVNWTTLDSTQADTWAAQIVTWVESVVGAGENGYAFLDVCFHRYFSWMFGEGSGTTQFCDGSRTWQSGHGLEKDASTADPPLLGANYDDAWAEIEGHPRWPTMNDNVQYFVQKIVQLLKDGNKGGYAMTLGDFRPAEYDTTADFHNFSRSFSRHTYLENIHGGFYDYEWNPDPPYDPSTSVWYNLKSVWEAHETNVAGIKCVQGLGGLGTISNFITLDWRPRGFGWVALLEDSTGSTTKWPTTWPLTDGQDFVAQWSLLAAERMALFPMQDLVVATAAQSITIDLSEPGLTLMDAAAPAAAAELLTVYRELPPGAVEQTVVVIAS
jgi:hypothetical protein